MRKWLPNYKINILYPGDKYSRLRSTGTISHKIEPDRLHGTTDPVQIFSFLHLCSGSQYKSNSLLWKEKIPIYCLPFSSWWMSVNVCIQNINILATCDGPPSSVKGKLIKWGHALTIFLLLIYFLNYSEKDLNTEQTKNKVEG